MAGLLGDSFEDPRTLATLAAAGALMSGRPLGQGLLGAVQSYSGLLGDAQDRLTKKAYTDSQIEENRSQAALRQQQVQLGAQKQQQIQGLLQGVLGGNSLPSGQGPSVAGTTPMPSASSLRGVPLEQIAALKAAGGPDLLEVWKTANVPTTLAANSYATLPGAEPTYLPDPSKGVGFRGGRVEALPGFGAIAQLEGQKVGAQEAARAPYNFQEGYDTATGAPVRRSVASMVRQESGAGYANEGQMRNQMQGIPQEMADYNRRELAAASRDLQNPNLDAGSRQQLQAYVQELQGKTGAPSSRALSPAIGIQSGPTPEQAAQNEARRTGMIEQAKADVTPARAKVSAVDSASDALGVIDKALKHPGLSAATGLSGKIDPRNYIPGTDAKDFQIVLDQVKGGAFLSAFQSLKGGGAITEVEGKKAEDAIARLNRAQSTGEFTSALNDYKSVLQRGLSRAQGNLGGATGSFDSPTSGMPSDISSLLNKYGGGR